MSKRKFIEYVDEDGHYCTLRVSEFGGWSRRYDGRGLLHIKHDSHPLVVQDVEQVEIQVRGIVADRQGDPLLSEEEMGTE